MFNAGSITGGNIGNGGEPERLRRQSSGSSFYSKSDVDSEFSKSVGGLFRDVPVFINDPIVTRTVVLNISSSFSFTAHIRAD